MKKLSNLVLIFWIILQVSDLAAKQRITKPEIHESEKQMDACELDSDCMHIRQGQCGHACVNKKFELEGLSRANAMDAIKDCIPAKVQTAKPACKEKQCVCN